LPKISTAWVGRTNVTDDRQTTDGRAIAYSEREREFTFAKNDLFGFPKVKSLQYTGEVGKCTGNWCQISSGFNTPKSLKSVNFWQSYSKNKKVDVFWGHSVDYLFLPWAGNDVPNPRVQRYKLIPGFHSRPSYWRHWRVLAVLFIVLSFVVLFAVESETVAREYKFMEFVTCCSKVLITARVKWSNAGGSSCTVYCIDRLHCWLRL